MGIAGTVVETFGPFLIPAALFVAGVLFYLVVWWLGRIGVLNGQG